MAEERGQPRRVPRIVILGGGFAGAYCAQALEKAARKGRAKVVLIDRHNFFVFHPLLIEAGTGDLEPRHVVVPLRDFIRHGDYRMGEIAGIDAAARRVFYRTFGREEPVAIEYDHLVIALGSVTRVPPVPGIEAHGFDIKDLTDAVRLRDRAIQMLEAASVTEEEARRRTLLHFVIVGGSYTGVEMAGELDEFLDSALDDYPRLKRADWRVTLVEAGDRILSTLSEELSAYALKNLRKRRANVVLNTRVARVEAEAVTLDDGTRLDAATTIVAAGIRPNPLLERFDLPRERSGAVVCERDLRVKGFENVWAAGDCAFNPDGEGRPYPATAQHATREGKHLARNIERVLAGKPTRPCDLRSQGSVAALGCRTGVAQVFGVKLTGFWAWWVWRTVYLFKMPRLGRKVRVAIDWTLDLLFSRDYVQLGIHRPGLRAVGEDGSAASGPARGEAAREEAAGVVTGE